MAVYKNKAGQYVPVYAYNYVEQKGQDIAGTDVTAKVFLNGGTVGTLISGTNPSKMGTLGGLWFALSQAESNNDVIAIIPETSVGSVSISPVFIYTQPETRDVGTAQRVNSIPDVGTISLALEVGTTQRTNSIPDIGTISLALEVGTTQRANSIPNPTGGTIGLVSAVTNLTFDGTNVNANMEKVGGEATNDGVAWSDYYKIELSRTVGTMVRAGNQYVVLDQSGGTTMVITAGTDARVVAI